MRARLRMLGRWALGLLALCALAVAAAGLLEAGARWRFQEIARSNPYVLREQRLTPEFSEAFSDDLWREKWYAYVPGKAITTVVEGERYEVAINSRGFRSREVELPKPPGKFRIVCIGGSTTVEGSTNEDTYPARLERALNEHFGTDAFEVVNAGVSGMRAADELRKLPEYLALEPDLLLEYNGVNDLCWGVLAELEHRAPQWRWWFWRSVFLRFHIDRPFQPSTREMARLTRNTVLPSLRALYRQAHENGVDVAFVTFLRPSPEKLTSEEHDFFDQNLRRRWGRWSASFDSYARMVDAYDWELAAMAAELGAGFLRIDVGYPGTTAEFQDICHLTRAGIEEKTNRIARELIDYLGERHGKTLAERL